nr:C-type mannose receptor 2-like [Danio rerio]|eukprot:XP_021322025.1 C-type mannose receptor 2-like [Danio rerio]
MDESLVVLLLLSGLFCSSSAVSRQYNYINMRMSWSDAQSYCRERFTDLATVDNMDDVNRLINTVDAGYSGSVWIGLKRVIPKRWVWSNGDDTIAQYSNWGPGEPGSGNDCVILNLTWSTAKCSDLNLALCLNRELNVFYIKTLYSKGFYAVSIYQMNWLDAQTYCRKNFRDLVTISNSNNDKFANSMVIMSRSPAWIGLFRDSWEWSDKWSRSFRYWAAGQPTQSAESGDCVGMTRKNSGQWASYSCDLQQPFICHGGSIFVYIYNYINLRMSWSDAQSYCRERFTDLATVDTMDDVKRLINTVDAGYNGSVWIGLKRGTQKCWGWSNREDTLPQHTNWKYRHLKDEEECGDFAIGVWQSYPCSSNLPFVCYSESIGLIRVQKLKNWTQAQSFCRRHYTDLVNIRNSKEHKQLKSVTPLGSWIWTGLYRNSWEWSDKLSRFFRYWAAGQPSQSAGSEDCVENKKPGCTQTHGDLCHLGDQH